MELETLQVSVDRRVATVTLNRPEHMNAATFTMFDELETTVARLAGDAGVGALVLIGAGDHFSAGADIGNFEFNTSSDAFTFTRRVNRTYLGLERFWKPVVAAVRGYALGFGLEITLPCDIVVASDTARFGLPEIRLGLLPAVTLTRGVRMMGRRAISYLALTGDQIDANRARQIGLCNLVVPDDQLEKTVATMAARLAQGPPLAIEVTKRIIHRGASDDYDEITCFMPGLLLSQDLKEGRAAFADRRKPEFRGT